MTDQELLTAIQYALVEPPDGGSSWPSGLWTRDEVIQALNTRQRQLLRDTHLIVTRTETPVTANTNPVTLPADWIATLGGVWRTAGGVRTPLSPADAFEADLALPSWEVTPDIPLAILDGDEGTLTLRLSPIPVADGTLELLYVALPTAATGHGVTLSMPDEFLDGVKYGTLADLLGGKVGRASDPARAQYCEERFGLVEMAAELILGGWA